MSLSSPVRNTVLPLRIQDRLNRMFARDTGFSGPQLLDFFSRYDVNIESYPSSGAPSRKLMFEDCLARFDRDAQLGILVDLLNYDGTFKHGPPRAEDVEFVHGWLIDRGSMSRSGNRTSTGPHSRQTTSVDSAPSNSKAPEWDVFVSHASEDKEDFARPLAQALKNRDLRVWFDEFTLRVGDSLRRAIDTGLARSRYGVVIISPAFLNKEWPQRELDGLVAREADGRKVILPVWHNIDATTLLQYSPMLAGRLAASSNKGLSQVVDELLEAMK